MSLKRIGLLVWKEFTQFRRDPLLPQLVLLMPILQLIMFGYVVGADVRNIPTAIVDQDRTTASRQVGEAFTSSGYFVVNARPSGEAEVRALMDRGEVQVAVLLPPGMQRDLERGRQV